MTIAKICTLLLLLFGVLTVAGIQMDFWGFRMVMHFPLIVLKIFIFFENHGNPLKGSLHRFGYRNFCVNVYTCISVVKPSIDVNLGLN